MAPSTLLITHNQTQQLRGEALCVGHTIDLCISIDPVRHHMHSSCVLHSSNLYHMKQSDFPDGAPLTSKSVM